MTSTNEIHPYAQQLRDAFAGPTSRRDREAVMSNLRKARNALDAATRDMNAGDIRSEIDAMVSRVTKLTLDLGIEFGD
jgi:hypothetical protein